MTLTVTGLNKWFVIMSSK